MKFKEITLLTVAAAGIAGVLALHKQADEIAKLAAAKPPAVAAPVTAAVAPPAPGRPIPYPLKTCVVSGDELGGDMGPPIVFIYTNNGANQEIKFCCPDCKPKFLQDPDKYMKIIQAAEATNH